MRCPRCEPGKEIIRVTCYPLFYVYLYQDDRVMDSEQAEGFTWNNDSLVKCIVCGWDGTVHTAQHNTGEDASCLHRG